MKELFNLEPFQNIVTQLSEVMPTVIGAIIFIIAAWLTIKIILFIVRKSLKITKVDKFLSRIAENTNILSDSIKISPTNILIGFIKWFLILVFLILGSDLLGLSIVSSEVGKLISYLPKIFSAFIIFGFGLYLANTVRQSIQQMIKSLEINGSRLISTIIFYIIVAIISITALNQAGINTDVITKNLSIILGAFLAAFAIALGLGTRDVVTRLILGFYARKNFTIGQQVRIEDFEGKIETIDNICITVVGEHGKRIYPIKMISNHKVEIL